ncbi:two-component sensor histidine kinase [Kitasatospora phosalacinea]|uniref:Two-component sensor histidine kinase n=1 Tax=Kitasatospora phosalacinea TaxID=2065 RepID=A0A9W6QBI3_9ACTN|nr:sensor histidine kinase [Kitasatospora phosalacinea]GLW71983.1 two-component sensor histidine kinase [Kitasatospora phosalacinea]
MPRTEPHAAPAGPTPALRLANLAVHGLFLTLLAVLLARAAADGALGPAGWATAGALAAGYAAGGVLRGIRTSRALGAAWLLAVAALWIALTLQHPEFSYLAFPLYFVCLHVLPPRYALPAVAALTAAVLAAQATTPGGLTTAKVIGPLAGLAVALLTAYGYAALYRESRARQQLIDDLVRTRDELAASQREAGRLAERQRLAREIHDTLAQGLAGIVLLAREARGADGGGADAAPLLDEIERTASANLAEARRFVHAHTPPALDGTTLTDALRRLADGADAAFHRDGDPYPLPVEAEVALLRLTQEALANAVRHAHAAHVAVTLAYLDDAVTLDVYDDGTGFDPATAPAPGSFGLHGMHERIAALGGTLTVESAPGEGTAVAATLPLRADRPDGVPGGVRSGAGRSSSAGVRR